MEKCPSTGLANAASASDNFFSIFSDMIDLE
jgi:hypothetical protein